MAAKRSDRGSRPTGLVGACLAVLIASACGSTSPETTPPARDAAGQSHDAAGKDAATAPADASLPADAAVTPDTGSASEVDADTSPDGAPSADAAADAGTSGGDTGGTPIPGVAKIMVFGSSNEVRTCWRAFLWKKLRAAGITNFDFVGSMMDGPDCGVPGYDMDDQSVSGTRVLTITAKQFHDRFSAHPPDIVLMHVGGGDLLDGVAPAKVIPAFTLALMQARAVNPHVRLIIAQHTPEQEAGCGNCTAAVMMLNALIVDWAKQMNTADSPVTSVDLFTGIVLATDTVDMVHLNEAGSEKVSDRWLAALTPILKP